MITIRQATSDDAPAIEALTREQISEKSEPFDPKRFQWGMLRRLYDPVQKNGFLVAIYEDTEPDEYLRGMVGIIFAELRVDPFGQSEAFIKQLYVKNDFRNQGIGQKLLNKLINHLEKIDIHTIQAYISSERENIFKMYQQLNFKKKYSIMELNLKEQEPEKK